MQAMTVTEVTEVNEDGADKRQHDLDFRHAIVLPAFKGIDAQSDIEGLVNPRGFVPVGVPKTG